MIEFVYVFQGSDHCGILSSGRHAVSSVLLGIVNL